MRIPYSPAVLSSTRGVIAAEGDALGECGDCGAVVSYDPESMPAGSSPLCRDCGLAALGLGSF